MNFKKMIASGAAAAMMLASLSISAFAALTTDNLALKADKTEAAAGNEVYISLRMNDNNTGYITGIGAKLSYDEDAFEFVSAKSDFLPTLTMNAANGVLGLAATADSNTITTGDLFYATFKVKNGAEGGAKDFTLTELLLTENDAESEINATASVTTATVTVNIKAPRKIHTPSVSIAGKKATWTCDDTEAKPTKYKVVLYKDGAAVYETEVAGTEYDFASKVDTSAKYNVKVTALQTSSLYTNSDEAEAGETVITVDSAVTPTSKDYVTGSGDFVLTMDLNGNTLDSISGLTVDTDYTVSGNTVTIKGDKLTSTTYNFKFVYDGKEVNTVAVTVNVTEAADAATLVLAERQLNNYSTNDTVANDGSEDGLIVISNSVLPVTNFLGVQFTINNTKADGYDAVEYEIVPADGFTVLCDESGMYEINVKPVNGITPSVKENNVGEGIVIAKLVRKGNSYGKGEIKAGNITVTVEKSDNTYAKLTADSFSFLYDIPEPTEKLNVNVNFTLPTLTSNAADYQSMTVTLYSARLGNIELALAENDGTAPVYKSEDEKIKATLKSSDNKYELVVEGLPKFEAYTVSIKGDGYRDAKAQFVLNEETTVNFWNNAYDTEVPFITKASEKKFDKVNFLAGDIIMNGVIDLYDLSAVSSYYGKSGLTADDTDYIQYDLNRDGKVDLIDITMLLAGWAR